MSVTIIQEKLKSYQCQSIQDEENALKEITQEIALLSLSRAGFFREAAFQGGTALRILYGLNRFSEDLDFILLDSTQNFSWKPYLQAVAEEFEAYGYKLEIKDRAKTEGAVKAVFLKDDSIGKVLSLGSWNRGRGDAKKISIKLEIDIHPPHGSEYELKFLNFPLAFSVNAQDKPSLFAGKSHALLCRKYAKGRDWFDFLWYVGQGVGLNFSFLESALEQSGPWQGKSLKVTKEWYRKQMEAKIRSIDWKAARRDVERFLRPRDLATLELWSDELFLDSLRRLKF